MRSPWVFMSVAGSQHLIEALLENPLPVLKPYIVAYRVLVFSAMGISMRDA